MIEAVNSVLSNAPHLKVAAQQQSAMNSFAANPDRVQQVTAQAPYISLYIKVDVNFDKALLLMRDSDTGDVVRQIPSEPQLEAYRRAQKVLNPDVGPASKREEGETVSSTHAPTISVSETPDKKAAPAPAAPAPDTSSAPKAESYSVDTSA